MQCEYCSKEHDGSFATGRFCNRKCSNGFSTKARREEINKKVSEKLSKKFNSLNREDEKENIQYNFKQKFTINNCNLLFKEDCKYRQSTVKRVFRRLYPDRMKTCEICRIPNNWNDKILMLQLDHINGIKTDNRLENIRIICPNCHSQTPTFSGKNIKYNR